ncbi:MAG: DNA glycosylase AlkZ-like family protein [Ardenticatenaceae bacterium]
MTNRPPVSVRLLPYFDPYVVAVARPSHYLLPEGHKARVYRAQGWISPVVLVDGGMAGVWEYDRQQSGVVVKVEMFAPPPARIKQGIEAEAEQLGDFWETKVELAFTQR